MIQLNSLYNFRDLGGIVNKNGKKIRKKMLYRSNALNDLNEADQSILVDYYGVKSVIDFRNETERLSKPDSLPENVKYFPLAGSSMKLGDADYTNNKKRMSTNDKIKLGLTQRYENMEEKMKDTMRSFVTDPVKRAMYSQMLWTCLNEEAAVLIHCTAGKDRCGFGCAILLSALDVPKEAIYKDYLYTNVMKAKENERKMADFVSLTQDRMLLKNLNSMLIASATYMDAAMEEIDRIFGDVQGFLVQGLSFDSEAQSQLRMRFLELV